MPYVVCNLIFHIDWNGLSNHCMNATEIDRLFNPKNTEMSIFACIETLTFKMVYELW